MSRLGPNHPRQVVAVSHPGVGRETIGHDGRTHNRVVRHEPLQRRRGVVLDGRQPDAARLPARDCLNGRSDQYLAFGAAALPAANRIVLGPVSDAALVDLDDPLQRVTFRVDHRPPQLVKQQPGGLVGADAELGLELQRRYPVRVGRDEVCRQEPSTQRQMRPVHHGPGRRRGLPAAGSAFPSPRLGFELPALAPAACGTDKAVWPAATRQPVGTRRVVRERRHELLQRRRPVMLPAADLTMRRHSGRVA